MEISIKATINHRMYMLFFETGYWVFNGSLNHRDKWSCQLMYGPFGYYSEVPYAYRKEA